jgi:hypothetical protein
MSSFAPASIKTTTAGADPTKHVNYTLGMVLGVDDFTQEFAYLSGRDQWLARDLIGYGTVNGLQVEIRDPEIIVQPGVALSPAGQLIRVPATQCARLDQWAALDKNKNRLPQNGVARLYVVLCYRECPTDLAPIPGEPCRSEEETMQPSRLADDFKLELRFEPPEQCEEEALREFVEWLHASLEITDAGIDFISVEDFLQTIREAVNPVTSPPCSSPFFLLDSLPLGLRVHTGDVCEYLRAAFRLWVTELRPLWKTDYLSRWHGCGGQSSTEAHHQEDCLLLAELRVPFTGGAINIADAVIDEEHRPYLLHLRMLQEWVLCGKGAGTVAAMALDELSDVTAPAPQNGQALIFQNGEWVARTITGTPAIGPAGGDLRGTYPNPNVDGILGSPINPAPTANNQLLVFNRTLNRWQGRLLALDELGDVNAPAPIDGQVLTRQGTEWIAAPIPPAAPVTLPILLPLAAVTFTDSTTTDLIFDLWFNLDAPANRAEVIDVNSITNNLQPLAEMNAPGPGFLRRLAVNSVQQVQIPPAPPQPALAVRNRFTVRIGVVNDRRVSMELLRFNFDISNLQVITDGATNTQQSLLSFASRNGIRYHGFDGQNTVTLFVRGRR